MELNDIKKLLYKENPIAYFINVTKDGILYEVIIENKLNDNTTSIKFLIPLNDLGDAQFGKQEHAKYLIRWIVK